LTSPDKISSEWRLDSTNRLLEEAVFAAIDQLNETLALGQQLAKSRDAVLADSGGQLDSMAVVNLLVFIEDEVAQHFGRALDLLGINPFEPEDLKTVGSVIDAINRRLSH
jgi:acyl carrier protein